MEDFVTFEIAKKLKEKGFIGNGNIGCCFGFYCEEGLDINIVYDDLDNSELLCNEYLRPSISQVLKWLRKEKELHIEFIANASGYWYIVSHTPRRGCSNLYRCYDGGTNDAGEWDDYEQCALSAIKYVLDNLI